jgi:hypothetical protein
MGIDCGYDRPLLPNRPPGVSDRSGTADVPFAEWPRDLLGYFAVADAVAEASADPTGPKMTSR